MLPQAFLNRMESMLGNEYPAFLESYDKDKYQALRLNSIKGDTAQMKEKVPFSLQPVAWAKDGFYYEKDDTPGRHPLHEAGVYYIQEPSAMAPVSYLMEDYDVVQKEAADCQERILDLCAAPGGKSTQIAARMHEMYTSGKWKEQGLLICNEIHPARAKILSENIERMGVCNALVTNETPQKLSDNFREYFDRILVDAPCSGEGMFRKNEDACDEWSPENVENCAARQAEILDCAAEMLKPGGRLVYSTCTFAPTENEGSISRFLERHPEFSILPVEKKDGMMPGVPAWTEHPADGLEHTIRLWPHHLKGEGHYLAVLQKAGVLSRTCQGYCRNGVEKGISEKECREFFAFAEENLVKNITGNFLKFGDQLYRMPEGMPSIRNLKVLRPGLHLGTLKKNRFEPSHALALALRPDQVKHVCNLESDCPQIKAYLNGQTLNMDGEKGWYLVTVDGYSIGWGKLAGGILKNHYPKGLRKNG